MIPLYKEYKEKVKALAFQTREERKNYRAKKKDKNFVPTNGFGCYDSLNPMEFRNIHVAMSLFRGRTMDQIEPKRREGNKGPIASWYKGWEYYEDILKKLQEAKIEHEKTLCVDKE